MYHWGFRGCFLGEMWNENEREGRFTWIDSEEGALSLQLREDPLCGDENSRNTFVGYQYGNLR